MAKDSTRRSRRKQIWKHYCSTRKTEDRLPWGRWQRRPRILLHCMQRRLALTVFRFSKDARSSEIDALQNAKAVLSGADFSWLQIGRSNKPEDDLAKEMTHDLEIHFNKITPFGKEDTAKELQNHSSKTQDTRRCSRKCGCCRNEMGCALRSDSIARSYYQKVRYHCSLGNAGDRRIQRCSPLPSRESTGSLARRRSS